MIKRSLAFIAMAFFSIFTGVADAQYIEAEFYNDKNFGKYLFSSLISPTAPMMEAASLNKTENDKVSSVKMKGFACILMFKDSDFRGSWKLISSSITDMKEPGFNFNDTMSSFVMFYCPSPIAYVYENIITHNSGGYHYPLVTGNLRTRLGSFNDEASAINVPDGKCLKIWKHSPTSAQLSSSANYNSWYNNPDFTFTSGYHDLNNYNFNDQASAFELLDWKLQIINNNQPVWRCEK